MGKSILREFDVLEETVLPMIMTPKLCSRRIPSRDMAKLQQPSSSIRLHVQAYHSEVQPPEHASTSQTREMDFLLIRLSDLRTFVPRVRAPCKAWNLRVGE